MKRTLAVLAVPVALAVAVVAYIAVMALLPNGTEKYSGVKRDVAKRALFFEQYTSSISPLPSFMRRLHVEDVRPISAEEKKQACHNPSYTSDDSSSPYYYVAIVKIQPLFEPGTQLITEYGCEFWPMDIGYPVD